MPFLFFDWETRSSLDLTVTGTLKYVLDPSTQPLLLSWAVDDEPVKLWCPDLRAELVPEVWAYVEGRMADVGVYPGRIGILLQQPDGYVIAHNAAFDRNVWQQIATPDYGFPYLPLERVLDNQAQAQASNLPGSLDFAGRALGLGTKTIGGKAIMKRFADAAQPLPGAPADIAALMAKGYSREKAVQTAIDAWALYLDYSVQDTELMRDVWKCTRPLDSIEWGEYWVSEKINDRGMLADLDVCAGAATYHVEEAAYVVERVKEITGGAIAGPSFTAQINQWVYDRLPDDLAELMVKKRDDEGYVTNLTGDKTIMTRLLEEFQTSDTPPADEVIDLIEVLQFGRSSSALKFQKILDQQVDGRLGGSYVFNGAGQTGRFCLAEGSRVLVRNPVGVVEERPIEQVTPDDEVWDGGSWVAHEGVVFSGVKEVFEYDGVTATADHQVFVSDNEKISLREAAERGSPIFKGTNACTQYTKSPLRPVDATSE